MRLWFVVWLLFSSGSAQSADYRHSAIVALQTVNDSTAFRTGLDLVVEYKYMPLTGRSLAIIASPGSQSLAGRLIFDIFQTEIPERCQAFILMDDAPAAVAETGFIYSNSDTNTSVRFYTLSWADYQLQPEMLEKVDQIVVDLAYSGLRESLALGVLISVLRAGAERQIPVVVLDRPNPLMGIETGGPISSASRFTGGLPLPARYGLTLGELAILINEENWLKTERSAALTVVRMANYDRDMRWATTGLKWNYPDRNVPDEESAVLQAGLFYLQYANISLGIGTIQPYQFIGAPWISGPELAQAVTRQRFEGVDVYPVNFTPRAENAGNAHPIYANVECSGISVRLRDLPRFDSYRFGIGLTAVISRLYPNQFKWIDPEAIDRFAGGPDFRIWVDIGADLIPMLANWNAAATVFQKTRLTYLLYPVQKK